MKSASAMEERDKYKQWMQNNSTDLAMKSAMEGRNKYKKWKKGTNIYFIIKLDSRKIEMANC
jgi:hypothetical protein